jgi:hypothetical protein
VKENLKRQSSVLDESKDVPRTVNLFRWRYPTNKLVVNNEDHLKAIKTTDFITRIEIEEILLLSEV